MTGKAFTGCLRFGAEGEAAASFYARIVEDSKLGRPGRYTEAGPGRLARSWLSSSNSSARSSWR